MFLIVVFLLDTPWGLSLVQYPYSATFRMRFPLLYAAFYLASLLLESIRMLTQKKMVEAQRLYQYLYAHDALTELFNRHGFNERMNQFFLDNTRNLTLIILDIDHFKEVNDRHGHVVGDEVLRAVATVLRKGLRATDAACRYGGEEFAVILVETDRLEAFSIAERIRVAAENNRIEHLDKSATISIGVSVLTPEDLAVDLIQRADDSMYVAKKKGRNQSYMQ